MSLPGHAIGLLLARSIRRGTATQLCQEGLVLIVNVRPWRLPSHPGHIPLILCIHLRQKPIPLDTGLGTDQHYLASA